MTQSTWPHTLDEYGIMAKSADRGGQTLAEHTWDVLSRLKDIRQLHPHIDQLSHPHIWDWLYWGCLLHDFGKATNGFQAILRGDEKNPWQGLYHRHEVISLAFIDWLFAKGHEDRCWVMAVIAFHHKDAAYIFDYYDSNKNPLDYTHNDRIAIKLVFDTLDGQIDSQLQHLLWTWINDCSLSWADDLKYRLSAVPKLSMWSQDTTLNLKHNVFKNLRELYKWQNQLTASEQRIASIIRGIILTADRAASAGTGTFPDLHLTNETALGKIEMGDLRDHQRKAHQLGEGSAILIAPTGSGKTEAALLWAATQKVARNTNRLFYTLPYQASMNAMAKRLLKWHYGLDDNLADEANNVVTIQHSRATLQFYRDHMDADGGADAKAAVAVAKAQKDRTRLNYYPVQVFSPYQMLKAAFSLKPYEPLLVDFTDALFIFDEIHAYNPERLALIIGMVGWLAQHYGARFFIMTATLPPMVKEALHNALPGCHEIAVDAEVFTESQRHEVQLHDGDLLENTNLVLNRYRDGDSVLVCCNTVARAQQAYDRLKDDIDSDNICLLHGRFNGKDRSEKEGWLLRRVGTRAEKRVPTVFVATQVVEVSLDVDFDTLYTDPAPLEALLQRFGRVNRGRTDEPLHDVNVFREPLGEDESKPYDHRYVERALNVLKPGAIDEGMVNELLAKVYTDELCEEWEDRYQTKLNEFRNSVLGMMQPFQSANEDLAKQFYKMFDGTQVLPLDCVDDYDDAIEDGGFLAGSEFLVNMSWKQFRILKHTVKAEDKYGIKHVDIPYHSEYGLDLEAVRVKDNDV